MQLSVLVDMPYTDLLAVAHQLMEEQGQAVSLTKEHTMEQRLTIRGVSLQPIRWVPSRAFKRR